MITVSHLYPDGRLARAVVDELKAAGMPDDDIGIIAPSRGGAADMLAGLGAFVLPEVGAVVAAGWLASAAVGAVAAGGIAGALGEAGVGGIDAAQLAEGVRRGGTLVAARMAREDRDYYESIMANADTLRPLGDYDPAAMATRLRGLVHLKRT